MSEPKGLFRSATVEGDADTKAKVAMATQRAGESGTSVKVINDGRAEGLHSKYDHTLESRDGHMVIIEHREGSLNDVEIEITDNTVVRISSNPSAEVAD